MRFVVINYVHARAEFVFGSYGDCLWMLKPRVPDGARATYGLRTNF